MERQDVFLQRTYIALTNVLNSPELLAVLTQYSFTDKVIREALKLHSSVEQLTVERERALEAQYQATQQLNQAKEELMSVFRIHLQTARLAYQRDADQYQDTLKLTGPVPRNTTDCLQHMKRFYTHVPVPMLEKYAVTPKEIVDAHRLADQVTELLALQTKAKSLPQQLSDTRQQTLEKLQAWMYRFEKIAQVAFDDRPQQLEAFGKTVRR